MAAESAPTIALYNDTGASSSDRITSDPTVYGVVSGQVGISTRVTIRDEMNDLLDSFSFSGVSASYRFKPTTLSEGAHTLTVTATQSGQTTKGSVKFIYDAILPTVSSPTDTVAQNSSAVPINIAAPADDLTPTSGLTITVGALPNDGVVTLSNGTPVVAGQSLTSTQLTGLLFRPTGTANQSSTFTYVVKDVAGNAGSGTATLNVTAANTPPGTKQPSPPVAPDAASISPTVSYKNGVFTLSGTASSPAGVRSVEITAQVDGVATDIGAATVNTDGTWTFSDRIGRHAQSFITATETDGAGGTASAGAGYSLQGGLQGALKARQDRYNADGSTVTATDLFKANGSQKAELFAGGQTFASSSFDTFDNASQPSNIFVFNPGFGRDVVNLFQVDGADHDTLSFKGSDYGTDPASQLAGVLNASRDTAAGLLIVDPTASSPGGGPGTHDRLLLKGITKDQLTANQGDIAFHA